MDKLEKHIIDNREQLDRHIPSPDIWARVQTKGPSIGIMRHNLLKYAALIIVILGSTLAYLDIRSTSLQNLLSPELLESELYYSNKVENLIKEAQALFTSSPELKNELMLEISMLDSIYAELKKDLKDNVSNAEVIEALTLNYRVKIGILEEMLEILKDENNIDEKKSSHEL